MSMEPPKVGEVWERDGNSYAVITVDRLGVGYNIVYADGCDGCGRMQMGAWLDWASKAKLIEGAEA